jgi:hypothetical protein
MGGSYIAHFTNVSMRFTTSGGLLRAAYYQITKHNIKQKSQKKTQVFLR